MRGNSFRVAIATLIIGVIALPSYTSYAAPTAKAGAACSKKGSTQTVSGKKFTCVAKGKKLVWNSGVAVSTPIALPTPTPSQTPAAVKVDFSKTYNTDDGYHTLFTEGPCEREKDIPSEWAELQDFFLRWSDCLGPIQVAQYTLGSKRPVTAFDSDQPFSNLTPCKTETPRGKQVTGFQSQPPDSYRKDRMWPGPNVVIQVVPFYTDDLTKPSQTPSQTYGRYLALMKKWIDYSSDFGSNTTVRIPDEYLRLPGQISDYPVVHEGGPANERFRDDLVKAVDPYIDFTGANVVLAVPPPGLSYRKFIQGYLGKMVTNEGNVYVSMAVPSHIPSDGGATGLNMGTPFYWLHEIQHVGPGLPDTFLYGNLSAGMGQIGLMSRWGGDLLAWHKWSIGYIRDSQVRCVTSGQPSTHWLVPSSVQSQLTKAVVIPVSRTLTIVVESLRPAGLHYKLPLQSQGVIVYTVDADVVGDVHYATNIVKPSNREFSATPFFMANAPLKEGEYALTNGYKITVVESGTFGDVVRVEKV